MGRARRGGGSADVTVVLPRVSSRYRQGFRPDIEGLRAIAVIAVVGFHAAVPGMSGGYVGVDVFFVISGFLITGLILGDLEKSGTFSLKEFYARRARRILPAAGVVLAATSAAGALWLTPLRRQDTAYDVLAAALNVSNWRFIALETDYLAAGRAESPLLHYWSLAVEEQFYLVWAPLALVLALVARGLRRSAFPIIAVAISAITVASFALSLGWTTTNASLAYLGSPSRAWQFGVGALGALAAPYLTAPLRKGVGGRTLGAVLAFIGTAAVAWSVVSYTKATPFPGTAAIVPTLGTVVILLAGSGIGKRTGPIGIAWVLATPPVRFLGRLSYSWYLWHWPVLIIWEAHFGAQAWQAKAMLMLGSAVPAWLTMQLVEGPVRLSPRVTAMPWRGLTAGLAATLLPLAAGLFLNVSAISALAVANTVVAAAPPAQPLPSGAPPRPIDEGHLYLSPLPVVAPGPPRPTAKDARADVPQIGACQVSKNNTTNGTCLFGNVSGKDRVVLLGDSHATQWYPALAEVAKPRGWALEILGKDGCPVHTFEIKSRNVPQVYKECAVWRDKVIARILRGPKPKLIMVGTMMEREYVGPHYIDTWDETLNKLKTLGAPIVYLRDAPYPGRDVPDCVSGMPIGGSACDVARKDTLFPDAMADLIRSGARPGVHLLDFTNALCPYEMCQVIIDGILVYKDHSHITATASRALAARMEKQLLDHGLIEPARV